MHPYWIEKLEESRKTSVSTFWVVMFLVVMLPILLIMSTDLYLVIGIVAFGTAALRIYWVGNEEPAVDPLVDKKNRVNEEIEVSQASLPQVDALDSTAGQFAVPAVLEVTGEMQALSGAQPVLQSTDTQTDGFFTVEIEPGQPVVESAGSVPVQIPVPVPASAVMQAGETDLSQSPVEIIETVEAPALTTGHFHDLVSSSGHQSVVAEESVEHPNRMQVSRRGGQQTRRKVSH